MKKNICNYFIILVGLSITGLSFAMERAPKSVNRREKREEQQRMWEGDLKLINPEEITGTILVEIINQTEKPLKLETDSTIIGSIILPQSSTELPWTHKVPLYKISKNLSAFQGDLVDNRHSTHSTIYIGLSKDPDLKSYTLTASLMNDPTEVEPLFTKSKDIGDISNYKVIAKIIDEHNSSIEVEENKKRSFIQRVISGSKAHIPKDEKTSYKH